MHKPLLALTLLAFALAGCKSGGGSDPATGELSLLLTDAASDELDQFEVEVSNIVFTKANGNTVSVMPRSTRIDFVALQSLNELVAGLTLEAGSYRSVALVLDFADAAVVISGQATPAAVVDENGSAITGAIDVKVEFPAGSRPVVGAARHNLFVLDLELDQSVAVDAGNNRVTFTPVMRAEIDPSNPRPVVTTGFLHSLDIDARSFVVERRAIDNSVLGTFTVQTHGSTVFQLDGVLGAGAPGLGGLAAHIGQRVFVQGTMSSATRVLDAVAVESGHGVPGNGQDWVIGHVVARSGGAGSDPVLTVLGRSRDVSSGTRNYNTAHTVNLAMANTKVARRGAGNSLDTDAVNVGQRVWIFGTLSGTTLDASTTTGVARMLETHIFGIATGAPVNNVVTVDLVRFGLRAETAFNFTVSSQVQADPDNFEIGIGGLGTSGITTGSKLHATGWISGVGAAQPDATAASVVNRSTTARIMWCHWAPPSSTAVDGSSAAGTVVLDVSAAVIRTVGDGFGPYTLTPQPAPSLVPLAGFGFYRIIENGSIEANLSFAAFRDSLLQRTATTPVRRITALGTFDESTQRFSALSTTVVLN